MTVEWESVSAPRGSFIGWGTQEGQHVTGQVEAIDLTSGRDHQGNPVPELSVELTEPAASFRKDGTRTDYDAGTTVRLTVSQHGLKRDITAARLNPGDLVKIVLTGLETTRSGNTVKTFDVKVARRTLAVAASQDGPVPQSSFGGGGLSPAAPF